MPDSDPHATPPPESVFHGHDVPDRLETEQRSHPDRGEDPGEQSERARSDDGPHGPGVKQPGVDDPGDGR